MSGSVNDGSGSASKIYGSSTADSGISTMASEPAKVDTVPGRKTFKDDQVFDDFGDLESLS